MRFAFGPAIIMGGLRLSTSLAVVVPPGPFPCDWTSSPWLGTSTGSTGSRIFVDAVVLWFAFVNFAGDEVNHPLDFYSNKIRTRPYWFLLMVVIFVALTAFASTGGRMSLFLDHQPELAIAAFLLGFAIGVTVLVRLSAGAALAAMIAYPLVAAATVAIVLIPTLHIDRPGAYYSGAYFIFHILWVAWLNEGVRRHLREDASRSLLPPGAEKMTQLWAASVYGWSPLLFIGTTLAYAVDHLVAVGRYGFACALAYYVVAGLLLIGCCYRYRSTTTMN